MDDLPDDLLEVIFRYLPLWQLASTKRVCRKYASKIRKTIFSKEWRSIEANDTALYLLKDEIYANAKEAFETLKAGEWINWQFLSEVVTKIAHRYKIPMKNGRSVNYLMAQIVSHQIFGESENIHIIQKVNSDILYLFSDVYTVNHQKLSEFAFVCHSVGLEVAPFQKSYVCDTYFKSTSVPMLSTDIFLELRRGNIVGVALFM